MRLNPVGAAVLGLLVLTGLGAVVAGVTARTDPARATAILVESTGSRQVVSVLDGPRPGRHVVDWAGQVPMGQTFTVGLGGDCGCIPSPAVLEPRRQPNPWVIGLGLLALVCPVSGLVTGIRTVASGRRARGRAEAEVGRGPGPVVHLLPTFATATLPLHAELWPVDGGPSLGRVALGRVDRGFDPSVPFVAWGGPAFGGAVALASVDGRQLVLPTSDLLEGSAGPALDARVTAAAVALLGWPSPAGPGDPRRTATVDATLDQVRRRWPLSLAVTVLVATIVGLLLVVAIAGGLSAPVVALILLLATGMVVLPSWSQAPLRALIAPVVGSDRKLRRKVFRAVSQVRWLRGDESGAHGAPGPADGPGWTPSIPPPR